MSTLHPRVSSWQVLVILFTLSLCLTPFDLPGVLMPAFGARGAWWGGVPALFAGLWGTAVAVGLARRCRGRPWEETVRGTLGPVGGGAYLGALALLCFCSVPACLMVFGPAAQNALLPRLPLAFLAVMVAGAGTYAAHEGAETIARCAEALAPALFVGLLIIYVPLLIHARLGRLLPVRLPPAGAWLSPAVLGATGTVRGFLPLLLLGPAVRDAPRGGRLALAASGAWALIMAALVLPVAIFDAFLAPQFRFPFLAASMTVSWPWLPLRSMVVTLLVWYAITFLVFSTYLWMTSTILAHLIPRLPRQLAALLLGVGGAGAASLRLAEGSFNGFFDVWNVGVLVLGVAVPTFILVRVRSARSVSPSRTRGDAAA